VISNLVCRFGNLQGVLRATIENLDDVEGIGEIRARTIKESLRRIQEQLLMDNRRI
ncbi:MAG: diadenylate cyclase, partial [Clostridiales bacterium]|nr:diadenylate cyclase [Clostridiales bacterium]